MRYITNLWRWRRLWRPKNSTEWQSLCAIARMSIRTACMANNIVLATLSIVCRKMGSMPCAVPFAGRCIIWGLWVMPDTSDAPNVSEWSPPALLRCWLPPSSRRLTRASVQRLLSPEASVRGDPPLRLKPPPLYPTSVANVKPAQKSLREHIRGFTPDVMERIRAARRAYLPYTRGKSGWILLTTDFRRLP